MILTIDFDIIMGPSLNDEVENKISNQKYNWSLETLKPDLKIYTLITELLLSIKDKTKFEFIKSHHEVCNFINKPEVIINIDHHHDIFYDDKARNNQLYKNDLNCGNWVKYLYDNELLEKFIWVNNINSDAPRYLPTFTYEKINIYDFKLKEIPRKVIICLSPEWIHPDLFPLFTLWRKILE